ncbi:hypothetical protein BDZ85DRAFT_268645 [Elsinoe ampelina]|uniref:Uncharacterized protein n=1 Tax=Elsinoe ampelina TaxID=302913 RepID=A0A6A6G1T3_9PEZI|nr:hypothetical protein BDZ85DRAFT_268645 [Elsinoe ampelina]
MPLTEKPPCKNCEFEGQACDGIPIVQKAKATKPKVTKPLIKKLPNIQPLIEKTTTNTPKTIQPKITETAITKAVIPKSPITTQAITEAKTTKPSARKRKSAPIFEEDECDAVEGATTVPAGLPTMPQPSPGKKAETNISSTASKTTTSDDGLFVSQGKDDEVEGGTEPPRKQRKITIIEAPKPIYLSEASRLFQPIHFHSQLCCVLCCSTLYAVLGKKADTFVKEIQESGGYEGTHICGSCTDLRISILKCKQHQMVPCGISEGKNFSTLFPKLLKDESNKADPWCLLCSNLATHKCEVKGDGDESNGCGLILCDYCARAMRRSKGVLGTFIRDTPTTRTNARPMGLRADVELLRDGEHLSTLALQK